MVQYRYAKCSDEKTVDANSLRGIEHNGPYHCLGCGNELIAKVNGEIQSPHFAHKSRVECSQETYLHSAAKLLFYETYKKCVEDDVPFYIELRHTKRCRRFYYIKNKSCIVCVATKKYNLVDFYQGVKLEKKDGDFIPDVLIYSEINPEEKIYVEIAVTHFMSEEKEMSGNRVIEIPISFEKDFDVIKSMHLTESKATFVGFSSVSSEVSSEDCKCSKEMMFGFFVLNNGTCFLNHLPLVDLVSLRARRDDIKASFIHPDKGKHDDKGYGFSQRIGKIFYDFVIEAANKKVGIKNCFACRYSAWSYDDLSEKPVFCKYLKKSKKSNDAAFCKAYRIDTKNK